MEELLAVVETPSSFPSVGYEKMAAVSEGGV
jgi:hypothetical protein